MTYWMKYILALRIPAISYGGVLVFIAIKMTTQSSEHTLLPFLAVLAGLGATMAQNDYSDREVDSRKGKTFASENKERFFRFVIICWSTAIILSFATWARHGAISFIPIFITIMGLIYNHALKVPLFANAAIAIVCASPVIVPHLLGAEPPPGIGLFYASMACFQYGREILKDFEDQDIDYGHKWTLIQWLGDTASGRTSLAFYAVSTWLLLSFSQQYSAPWPLAIGFVPTLIILAVKRVDPPTASKAKLIGDICIAPLLFYLLFK